MPSRQPDPSDLDEDCFHARFDHLGKQFRLVSLPQITQRRQRQTSASERQHGVKNAYRQEAIALTHARRGLSDSWRESRRRRHLERRGVWTEMRRVFNDQESDNLLADSALL